MKDNYKCLGCDKLISCGSLASIALLPIVLDSYVAERIYKRTMGSITIAITEHQ